MNSILDDVVADAWARYVLYLGIDRASFGSTLRVVYNTRTCLTIQGFGHLTLELVGAPRRMIAVLSAAVAVLMITGVREPT